MSNVNVDVKLGVDKFFVDEGDAHIELADNPDKTELKKLVNACPANLYKILDDGAVQFDHAGCLECGTCRVLCGQTIVKKWEFPRGTMGVEYRYG